MNQRIREKKERSGEGEEGFSESERTGGTGNGKSSRRQYVCCAIASSCLSSTPRSMLHMMACGTTGEGTERTPTIYVFFNHKSPRPAAAAAPSRPLLLLPRLLCFLLLPSSFLLPPFLLCASAENGFATRKTLRLRARPCHAGRMNNCKHSVTCAASYVPRASQTSLVKPLGMSTLSTATSEKMHIIWEGEGVGTWLAD